MRAPSISRVPAPALVVGAVVSVQVGSAIAKTAFDEIGANGVTFYRLAVSGALLMALTRPRLRRWTRAQWGSAALLGLTMGAMNITFYLAIRTVPLGVAVTLEFLGPLCVALFQTRRLRDLGWVLLAAGGVGLLGLDDRTGPLLATGLVWAALAGAFWGLYILASARVGRLVPGLDGLAVALVVSTLLAAPFGVHGAVRGLDQPLVVATGVTVALLSSVIPYALELTALRRLPTRVFGVLMSLEPAAAALSGFVLLGQALGSAELAALALVSIASLGVTLGRRDKDPPVQPLE